MTEEYKFFHSPSGALADPQMSVEERVAQYKFEEQEKWRERRTPPVHFPSTWPVQILMPFGKAVARFSVTNDFGVTISVYYDDSDALGYMQAPYWEIYPVGGQLSAADEKDTQRFLVGEEQQMIEAIGKFGDPVRGAAVALGAFDKDEI
jgi:hypothetical protein